MPIQVASPVPAFQADAYFAQTDEFRPVQLADYRGHWLCLYFFPMAFSYVCPTELQRFHTLRPKFDRLDCAVLGCSCDSHLVLKAWCDHEPKLNELNHPIMSDVTKRIALDYGVLLPQRGVALRGTFLIDPEGILRFACVNDLYVGRSPDEVLRSLEALQTSQMCPCNWKKGEATIEA